MPQNSFSARRTGGGQRKSVTSVKKAKKKLEYMAIYIVTTFLACYTVYYISQLITNRMKEAEKVSHKFAIIFIIFFLEAIQYTTCPAVFNPLFGTGSLPGDIWIHA